MESNDGSVSNEIILRRIRNRIIETLELASSFEEQIEYEKKVPIANVPTEVINQWEDWVTYPKEIEVYYPDPVFTANERQVIKEFHKVWESVSEKTPDPLPQLTELFESPYWNKLKEAAQIGLEVFMVRGKLPED